MSDGTQSCAPIDDQPFSRAMEGFAPLESEPLIAVAVSGGPDSMALLILLDRWARQRGGSVLALTVDHGLRPESAAEAHQVSAWCAVRGIAHETLRWTGAKPAVAIQYSARDARYRLLADACAARGILHLAVAHHADDQAETVLFRTERGSGPLGLAGMPASRSLGAVRMIRPLLGWPKAALDATCRHFGQAFIEDPSNISDRYARTGIRRRLAADAALRGSLLNGAAMAADDRRRRESGLARILGRLVEIRPDGMATIDRAQLIALDAASRRAVLSAALRTIGGRSFAPDPCAVERLDASLRSDGFSGSSLAGCSIRQRRGRVLLCREPGRTQPPVALDEDGRQFWDGRFGVRCLHPLPGRPLSIGALESLTFSALRRGFAGDIPGIVGAGLPALRLGDRLLAVPAVGWAEKDAPEVEVHYLPLWPLSSETFTVVSAGPDIMSL